MIQQINLLKLMSGFLLDQCTALTLSKAAGHWRREAVPNRGSWTLVVRSA